MVPERLWWQESFCGSDCNPTLNISLQCPEYLVKQQKWISTKEKRVIYLWYQDTLMYEHLLEIWAKGLNPQLTRGNTWFTKIARIYKDEMVKEFCKWY